METFDIIVLSSLGLSLIIGWFYWRPREKQVEKWDKEAKDGRGDWVPLVDEEGVGVIEPILHNYELLVLVLLVVLITNYYSLTKIWSLNDSFIVGVKQGVYHILFGYIFPPVMAIAVIIGFKIGVSPGRVIKVEKTIPFTSKKELEDEVIDGQKTGKQVETGKIRYDLDSEDPKGNDLETEILGVFENSEGEICEATTFRKAMNNEFVKWKLDKKYLGLFKGRTLVFGEVYQTETILSAHVERYIDKKQGGRILIKGGRIVRQGERIFRTFLTWNKEPGLVKTYLLAAYDEVDAMSRAVMAERSRQQEYIILGLRNNEQVLLSEREDFAQLRVALVLTQTHAGLSYDLGHIDATEISETEHKIRQIEYLGALSQVVTGLPTSEGEIQ